MMSARKERGQYPDYVEMMELKSRIMNDVRSMLADMCHTKIISYNKTLNSVAFKIKENLE